MDRPISPTELREVAENWDASADYCEREGWPALAERDRKIAAALRHAADVGERERKAEAPGVVLGRAE